jgi:hypothetical protein
MSRHGDEHINKLFDQIEEMVDSLDDMWEAEKVGKIGQRDMIRSSRYDPARALATEAFHEAVREEVRRMLKNKVNFIL